MHGIEGKRPILVKLICSSFNRSDRNFCLQMFTIKEIMLDK